MLFECIEVYLLCSFSNFALHIPHQPFTSQQIYPIKMAKDKSEKKSKKSKEVTETVTETIVTGEDVDMADVEVAKVCVYMDLLISRD